MKILHVIEGIEEACGISRFSMEIAKEQTIAGHTVCIVTRQNLDYPAGNLSIKTLTNPAEIDFTPDIVHIHCIWSMYVHRMAVWCRKKNVPYIISPHGALTPWALKFKWWKKIPALLVYQYNDLKRAAAFHITARKEQTNLKRLLLNQNAVIAPLGITPPGKKIEHRENIILFVGRIHPVKGLKNLIKAWGNISQNKRKGWKLVCAGPNNVGYQQKLISLANKLSLSTVEIQNIDFTNNSRNKTAHDFIIDLTNKKSDIIFTGTVRGALKDILYQSSKFFILPSFSENFGVVVLEALANGTPTITTTCTPWSDIKEHKCGWQIEPTVKEIKTSLEKALTLDTEEFEIYSANASQLVLHNYSWKNSAQTLTVFYSMLLQNKKTIGIKC